MRVLVEIVDVAPQDVYRELAEMNPAVVGIMADDGTVADLDGKPVRLDIREWHLPEPGEAPPGFGPDTHYHRSRVVSGAWVGDEHPGGRVPHAHDGKYGHDGPVVPL